VLLVHLLIKQLVLIVDLYYLMIVEEIVRANFSLILLMIQAVVDKQMTILEHE
jgi:hypothetical protein